MFSKELEQGVLELRRQLHLYCIRSPLGLCRILLALLAIAASGETIAANCTDQGAPAYCMGPEIGHYRYQVSDGNLVAQGTDEAETIALYRERYLAALGAGACTVTLTNNLPPIRPTPIGSGWTMQGDYSGALFNGVGQFWRHWWRYSTEEAFERIPLVVNATYTARGDPEPCTRSTRTHGAYVHRTRSIDCPLWPIYSGNITPPENAYCVRRTTVRDPTKSCTTCPALGNPVNPNTGNKFQIETDYLGEGPTPLRFVRQYNSSLWKGAQPPSATAAGFRSRLGPNWRSSYDRFVRFAEATIFATVYAYRPDGRTLYFGFENGQFTADADIADRLERIVDGAGNPTGWRYIVANTEEVETYDNSGKLTAITSRAGVVQTLAYDNAGRLATVTDSFGSALTFGYNTGGALTTLTAPDGGVYSYTYNAAGNVDSVTYPDGKVRTYLYNEPANTNGANQPYALTGIIDEANSRFSTYKYDSSQAVVSTEHAGGVEKYSFRYVGNLYAADYTVVTDPLLQERTYDFTTIHGVDRNVSINQPCANCGGPRAAATTYDANANVASLTDFKANKTCYLHDLARNLELFRLEGLAAPQSCPANLATYSPTPGTRERKIATQWHPSYRLPTQIDELGRRTSYTHDANGNILTHTVTDLTATPNVSRTWTYTYNAFGRVLTEDGPRTDVSDVTTYTYYNCTTGYQCGQVHTVTNAAGHTTTYNAYNAHGQPLAITDPNGVVSTLAYDQRQRLKSRTVGSEVEALDYWPTGLLKKATLPDGSYLEYTYDAAHRLIDINDAEGNRIHYDLDAMGNRTQEDSYDPSNELTQTRKRVFDALNRLHKELGAAGTAAVTTTFGYDNNGNQTSIAAPLGRNATQGYDELNRLTQFTDPRNGVTRHGYNALDQLISVTDPKGLVTYYEYNGLGDLKQQTSPDTGVTTKTYDSGGNIKTSTDARNVVATHTYDEMNRVATSSFAAGSTVDQTLTYSYDAGAYGKGQLTGVSDANHSLSWTYDEHARTLSSTQTVGSVSKTTSYSYLNGLRQSLTTPSGQLVTYGYTNGKITSVSVNGAPLITNVLYDPFGPIRQWSWGNGTLSVRTFNRDGKITQIDSAGLKSYGYDDAFRLTSITDATDAASSWAYGYDELDRLSTASKAGASLGYTYDGNGNRLTQTGSNASTFTIAANSNRLVSTSGAIGRTYGYDDAGNTTSYGGVTFAYNNRGRIKISTRNGVTTSYTYNALGQLIKKGSTALYYYDDAGRLLGIYDASGALTEEIIWLGEIPLATLRPKSAGGIDIYYIHSDHLMTPRVVTDANTNAVRWRWEAAPFGSGIVNDNPEGAGPFTFNLRFPGQIYLAETELHYNYARDYDPSTGRYAQSDPAGLEGGLNTYGYALNRPTMLIDVDGRLPLDPTCLLLRAAVVRTCKEANRRCEYSDSCEELDLKVRRHLACVIAQTQLSQKCFGWSITHGQRISDSYNGVQRCVRIAEDIGCGWCGPPRPKKTP